MPIKKCNLKKWILHNLSLHMSQGIHVSDLICPGKSEKIKMANSTWNLKHWRKSVIE